MIWAFDDRETERIWLGQRSRKLPSDIQEIARRKRRQLNRITQPVVSQFEIRRYTENKTQTST